MYSPIWQNKVESLEMISQYFKLTERQAEQFAQLDALYREWNSKINVISRKDIDNLYEHHVLHSLAIAKWLPIVSLFQGTAWGQIACLPGNTWEILVLHLM